MSKVRISEDERWPTYTLGDDYGEPADVPAETVKRWREAIKAYDKAQTEMGKVFDAAREQASKERAVEAAEKAVRDAQAKLDALKE